ncbi:TOMM precursor leader peptide-binding protein [Actinomyces ruminicola]|uniref:TOMM precursor leader peptide-binding protein n=1 Tax=Actinomyces ruminicola TaxID=332524 RepID=UPI0011C976D4|nr:TOMM precursor leader peptide-binding protein [Actinomyces ruminicola]
MDRQQIPDNPLLLPWRDYTIFHDRLVLRHGDGVVVFEGRASTTLLPDLMKLLDGSRSVAQLIDELGTQIEPAITAALTKLNSHGLLMSGSAKAERESPSVRTAIALTELVPGTPGDMVSVENAISAGRFVIIGDGTLADVIGTLLEQSGVSRAIRVEENANFDLLTSRELNGHRLIVAPGSPLSSAFSKVNQWALREKRDWLQVIPYDGKAAFLGPLFVPGETGCHECFRMRRRSTLDFHKEAVYVDEAADVGAFHRAREWRSLGQEHAVAGQAVLFALWWLLPLAHTLHPLLGRTAAMEWGMLGPTISSHILVRVPRCKDCGRGNMTGLPQPWYRTDVMAPTDATHEDGGLGHAHHPDHHYEGGSRNG